MSATTTIIGYVEHPGVSAEAGLRVPKYTAQHYARLVGRTIKEVWFTSFEEQPCPVLVLDDGKQVSVLMDPEGNGPGPLSID